jgi:hypothetical protein
MSVVIEMILSLCGVGGSLMAFTSSHHYAYLVISVICLAVFFFNLYFFVRPKTKTVKEAPKEKFINPFVALNEIESKLKKQYPQAVAAHQSLDESLSWQKVKPIEDAELKANAAYFYAKYVVKGPYPEGEDAIAKIGNYSYCYANHILKNRFPKGEHAIGNATGNANIAKIYGEFLASYYKGNASSSSLLMTPVEAFNEGSRLDAGDPRHNSRCMHQASRIQTNNCA